MQIYTAITGDNDKLDKLRQYGLGIMISSHRSVSIPKCINEFPVAIDNGAYSCWESGYPFDEYSFLNTMSKARQRKVSPDFVICPDIVAGGRKSLDFSIAWMGRLPYNRWALAVQDGITPDNLPTWLIKKGVTHIFVGGTEDWKWDTASIWVKWSHKNDFKCHIGRCNTLNYLKRALELGADSCDSTTFVRNDYWHIIDEFINPKQFTLF